MQWPKHAAECIRHKEKLFLKRRTETLKLRVGKLRVCSLFIQKHKKTWTAFVCLPLSAFRNVGLLTPTLWSNSRNRHGLMHQKIWRKERIEHEFDTAHFFEKASIENKIECARPLEVKQRPRTVSSICTWVTRTLSKRIRKGSIRFGKRVNIPTYVFQRIWSCALV